MNWPAIGAIAELLGAAGVIASLLYLARQIRNSAAEGRRAAAEAVLTKMMTAFQHTSAHPQLADVFLRGSTDLTSLSPQEALQFSSLLHSFVRLEVSRFSGQVNTRVYVCPPTLGSQKLPLRSGGVEGWQPAPVAHAATPWRRSNLSGETWPSEECLRFGL